VRWRDARHECPAFPWLGRMMSAASARCAACGSSTSPGQHFCPNCGMALNVNPTQPSPARPADDSWAPVLAAQEAAITAETAKFRQRVNTGLWLMIIAFGMLWIPYLSDLGSLLIFIGIIFLGLGRNGFDEPFRRWVVRGAILVILGLLVGVLSGLLFASEVANSAVTSGETLSAFVASLQPDLETLIVGAFIGTVFLVLGFVSLPFGKADSTIRRLLGGAALLALALGALQIAILWQQVLPVLVNATSSGTLNFGPIQALENESLELGLLQVVPDLMFLYAYYRTLSQLFPTQTYPPPPVNSNTQVRLG